MRIFISSPISLSLAIGVVLLSLSFNQKVLADHYEPKSALKPALNTSGNHPSPTLPKKSVTIQEDPELKRKMGRRAILQNWGLKSKGPNKHPDIIEKHHEGREMRKAEYIENVNSGEEPNYSAEAKRNTPLGNKGNYPLKDRGKHIGKPKGHSPGFKSEME